jgi:hypothetical protein
MREEVEKKTEMYETGSQLIAGVAAGALRRRRLARRGTCGVAVGGDLILRGGGMACACALNRNICVGGVKGLAMGISGVWGCHWVWGCHGVLGELAVRQDRGGWEGEARTGKLFDSCVFSPSWAGLDSLLLYTRLPPPAPPQ